MTNKNLEVNLSEKEALLICDFISYLEQHMQEARDLFKVNQKFLVSMSNKIYKQTGEYIDSLEV